MNTNTKSIVGAATSRLHPLLGLAAVMALAAIPGVGHAANVTLVATDTAGNSSFTSGTRWSDGQVPSPANDYFVPSSLSLRTPFDVASATFAGNSLTLGDNGAAVGILVLKTLTNSTVTANNLTLNKGSIQNGGTAAGAATFVTLTSNSITVGAGGATFDSGGGGRTINVNAAISGSGPITVSNSGATTFALANTYTGSTTVTGGALNAIDGVSLPTDSALGLLGGALGTSGTFTRGLGTGSGQVTLSGAGGFTAVGGDLVVAIGGTAAPTPLTVGVNGFAPAFMTLNYSTATNAIDFRNNVDLAGTTTFGITANGGTLANASTYSGVLSDSVGGGVFTKFGFGLLTLTGTNTHSGRTAVNQGVLRATDGTSLPATTNLSFNGGVFSPTGSTFTRSLGTGAGQVQWISGGSGGFAAVGNDVTVALGGTETPTPLVWGTTDSFNPGVFVLGYRIGTNTVTFTNNIDLSTPTAATTRNITSLGGVGVITGVISNTGAAQGTLGIEGDGTATGGIIVLAGANTYGGTTLIDVGTVGSGTVRATNNSSFGTSLIQFNAGGNGTTARLELANNVTVPNNINLSGRNTVTDAIRNVSGNNTLGGTIAVGTGGGLYAIQSDAGLLTLTGASGSTAGTAITSAATGGRNITLQGAGNGVVSGLIANGAGTVQLTKTGTGTWTLTAANPFTGPTVVAAGTLQLGDGTSGRDGTIASTSSVTTSAGATPNVTTGTLAFNRFGTTNTAAYVVSGAGNVSKLGPGSQTLTGANTYTGTTTVQAGTLRATAPAYTATVLGASTGGLDVQGGRFVFDYTDAADPIGQVKAILTAGYAGNFASGQIRSTVRPAGTTIGYGETPGSTVTVRVTLPGDADLNGAVDFNDFALLQTSFGQSGVTFAQGDFNYSDSVDFNDFALLQTNFGQSLPGGRAVFTKEQYAAVMSITNASQVPEPAALALVGLGVAGLLRRRRA